MRDIAYLRARWPELEADPSGAALAAELTRAAAARGFDVAAIRPHYDGCVFPAIKGRIAHLVEVTPYFEASPMEWSIQVHPRGVVSKLFGTRVRLELFGTFETVLRDEPRVHDVRWLRLSDLAAGRTDDEASSFDER